MSIRIMSEFFGLQLGSANRKMIALRLADFADDDGRGIWPTVERVAAECEVSVSTVQRVLKEFVTEGILVVVKPGGGGRGSSTRYDFDLERVRVRAAEIAGDKGVTVTPLNDGSEKGVSEADKGVSDTALGCHGDTRTVREPSSEPSSERGRERAGGQEGKPEAPPPDDLADEENPDRAGFHKRVMRFCSGKGFATGPWPGWDESSPGWIGKQFASLSREERAEAERWRDPYLLDFRDRKGKPMKVGIFLRDKAWTGLEPALLDRFEQWRQAKLKPDERPKPDGWAACRGPVGMARLIAFLLDGPADAQAARALAQTAFHSDPKLGHAWPSVLQWRLVLRQKGGLEFAPRWHALKDAMEAVPAGSDVLAAWKAEFERRGWPWLLEFDHGDVVYLPKGGPDGLGDFEEALARMEAEKGEGQQEAAE